MKNILIFFYSNLGAVINNKGKLQSNRNISLCCHLKHYYEEVCHELKLAFYV